MNDVETFPFPTRLLALCRFASPPTAAISWPTADGLTISHVGNEPTAQAPRVIPARERGTACHDAGMFRLSRKDDVEESVAAS